MQPYDPKLYETDPQRKAPGLSTDRAVKRGENVSEQEAGRRRFTLDPEKPEDPEKKGVSAEGENKLPSAFSLAAPKKQGKTASGGDEGGGGEQQALLNPFDPQLLAGVSAEEKATPVQRKELLALAKEMIGALEIHKKDGIQETRIVLTHPPIFEGATLSIKTYDTAKGELNLAFSNLSQEAKALLDQKLLRQDLMDSLREKGFTVHLFIATTGDEKPITASKTEKEEKEHQEKEQEEGQK